MNILSFFLYAADAVSSVGMLFAIVGGAMLLAGTFFWLAWTVAKAQEADASTYSAQKTEQWKAWVAVWAPLRKTFSLGFLLCVTAALIPSKTTFYAIAASELGERFVKLDAVQGVADDATKALQSWIKQQIEPPKGK